MELDAHLFEWRLVHNDFLGQAPFPHPHTPNPITRTKMHVSAHPS